ncbi:MAG: tetraacyldisaccharide 4'-kinase [Pseudomonadota bacterium]|nr:tetraacyldisaccharide 4'-kinase [Pseudomonadota bacterium]
MRAPEFWRGGYPLPLHLPLLPLSLAWRAGAAIRRATAGRPVRPAVPLVCVGNITAGGAGKTPTVIALAQWFEEQKLRPHVLTRGYGGALSGSGPHLVDPAIHDASQVGDEALLHAAVAPTVISASRAKGAMAAAEGADLVIMDDGHQNPTVARDLSIVVIDLGFGFGNGHLIPAGPLREPVAAGLSRANAVIGIGRGSFPDEVRRSGLPALRARLVPDLAAQMLSGERVVALTGIGRPLKFVDTLQELGCEVVGLQAHADHHVFREDEIMRALDVATARKAMVVTTTKDHVRLPEAARQMIRPVGVSLEFRQPELLDALLQPVADLARRGPGGGLTRPA